jgi:uncharacterized protein YbaR (Trm112 family)/SAM-dependent methyltransferase
MRITALEVLRCPTDGCHGRLAVAPGGEGDSQDLLCGLLRCRGCETLYPVLAGVPILVPEPARYLSSYRDAVLATLAEVGEATPRAVDLVIELAAVYPGSEPLRFGDDWDAAEAGLDAALALGPETPEGQAFAALEAAAQAATPTRAILEALGDRSRALLVELGPGAGELTERLRAVARSLIVGDLSLRSVLWSLERAGDSADGMVCSAEHLPLAKASASAIVAANLVDLLDDPDAFAASAARALRPGAPLVLTTPDPALGTPDPQATVQALEGAGLLVDAATPRLPWLRRVSERQVQIYVVDLIVGRRAG